ncbi:hypothetical protein [Actinomadura geliboluensis]|uniref:hypothetical protein n=1 Tax=Actinomadura geliboluensis TaxID=882440 RepID=UPI003699C53D
MSNTVADQFDIEITTLRDVPQSDVQHIREVVARVLAHAPRPVLYAKATLNVLPDPAVPRPYLVSLRVDLNGLPVNAYASATSMSEAGSLAAARLRARMQHVTRYWTTRRKGDRTAAANSRARY